MGRKFGLVILSLAFSMTGWNVGATAGSEEQQLTAYLNGRPIELADVGLWYCHDFDYPKIQCFKSSAGLERDVASRSTAQGGLSALAVHGPNDYVTIYAEPSYAGAYAHLSANYDQLWIIGWNDRISSYKARNTQRGEFFTDWFGSGYVRGFCCNTTMPWLTSTYDNKFSSVYRS
jgi:hypothetical protein